MLSWQKVHLICRLIIIIIWELRPEAEFYQLYICAIKGQVCLQHKNREQLNINDSLLALKLQKVILPNSARTTLHRMIETDRMPRSWARAYRVLQTVPSDAMKTHLCMIRRTSGRRHRVIEVAGEAEVEHQVRRVAEEGEGVLYPGGCQPVVVGKMLALVPKASADLQKSWLHWNESHSPNHSQRRHTEAVVAETIVVAAVFSVKLVPVANIVVAAAAVKLVPVVALKLVLAANVVVSFAAISPQTTGNKWMSYVRHRWKQPVSCCLISYSSCRSLLLSTPVG